MPKSAFQNEKILRIYEYLSEYTDEEHGVTVADIINRLSLYGIHAERKAIYRDFEILQKFGVDIVRHKENKKTLYFLVSRHFELAELKMLVDMTIASRFITPKKSAVLIEKLSSLCSRYEAKELKCEIFTIGTVKTENEIIYLNVDKIHSAMSKEYIIRFFYFGYNADKEKVYHNNGEAYTAYPISLVFSRDNYYLVAFDRFSRCIKHFRVDKMNRVTLHCEASDEEKGLRDSFDTSRLSKSVFEMYSGELVRVELAVPERLVGSMMDRFGSEIVFRKCDGDLYAFSTEVELSPLFFGWLAGFEGDVKILSPETARESYRKHILKLRRKL